jgi:hypothetical protein
MKSSFYVTFHFHMCKSSFQSSYGNNGVFDQWMLTDAAGLRFQYALSMCAELCAVHRFVAWDGFGRLNVFSIVPYLSTKYI